MCVFGISFWVVLNFDIVFVCDWWILVLFVEYGGLIFVCVVWVDGCMDICSMFVGGVCDWDIRCNFIVVGWKV